MMRALIAASFQLRLPVLAVSVLPMAVGIRAVKYAPFDVFPEFARSLVEIQTEAPGLSRSDVDALLSVLLEAAMNGVPDVAVFRSKSVLGLSSVRSDVTRRRNTPVEIGLGEPPPPDETTK